MTAELRAEHAALTAAIAKAEADQRALIAAEVAKATAAAEAALAEQRLTIERAEKAFIVEALRKTCDELLYIAPEQRESLFKALIDMRSDTRSPLMKAWRQVNAELTALARIDAAVAAATGEHRAATLQEAGIGRA